MRTDEVAVGPTSIMRVNLSRILRSPTKSSIDWVHTLAGDFMHLTMQPSLLYSVTIDLWIQFLQ